VLGRLKLARGEEIAVGKIFHWIEADLYLFHEIIDVLYFTIL
jgi:hypothetical protein